MVRRNVIRKASTKKAAKPRSVKFADIRYMGEEPIENVKIDLENDPRFIAALRWYDYYYDAEAVKSWLVDYLTTAKRDKKLISLIRSLPAWKISKTNGKIARLLQRGWTLPADVMVRFEERLNQLDNSQVVESPVIPVVKINLQDRVKARAIEMIELVDYHIDCLMIDNGYEFSLYNLLKAEKVSPVACNMMQEKIEACLADLDKEGYENFSKFKMRKFKAFYNAMLADIESYRMNKKATKVTKVRKQREKPVEKIVANAKYMKEFAPLKLVSISPQSVVKAQTLWVYNTKYRQLAVYNAADDQGLGIKGTTITNFNETTSIVKRLRKPDVTTQDVLTAGKVALRTLMDKIKSTPSVAKGRLNADTILLRVVN